MSFAGFLNAVSPPYSRARVPSGVRGVGSALSDPFILALADSLEDSLPSSATRFSPPSCLLKLRELSCQSLLSKTWPSSKDESFRFTNIAHLKQSHITPVHIPAPFFTSQLSDPIDAHCHSVLIVDGQLQPAVSNLSSLPGNVFVGSISAAPDPVIQIVSSYYADEFPDGDVFWDLNGFGAPDVLLVYIPDDIRVDKPLNLIFYSSQCREDGSSILPLSNPRCMVVVGKGGNVELVEQYLGKDVSFSYWTNSVTEIVIQPGAKVRHSYIQKQASPATHTKWTSVRQESCSTYENVEISTGAKLSRHNLHIQQLGPGTVTDLSAFHLCQSTQTQDLHSRLVLNYPKGFCRQLHKCVVSHSSGHGVFDGNIQVKRYAQMTDAGQLSRSLLLAPRATVNVKPSLQIVADDVNCTHGATISYLEWEPLFYFLARGVDIQTARNALLFSFGAEVTQRLQVLLRTSVENHIRLLMAESAFSD